MRRDCTSCRPVPQTVSQTVCDPVYETVCETVCDTGSTADLGRPGGAQRLRKTLMSCPGFRRNQWPSRL